MEFSNCNLHTHLMSGIAHAGYVTCTPVQEQVLQAGCDGADLYVQSQTGTGKTAAYLVLILHRMLSTAEDTVCKQGLVLVPTRELAVQVEQEATVLAQDTGIRVASFYGGVGYEQQEKALKKGVDILIGTPGRVIDLQKSGTMQLRSIAFLIIDEADRMFDMGFYPDLRTLLSALPAAERRQTMLFSATLNSWVKNLAWEYTKDAKEIVIEADTITVSEINQKLFHVAADKKMALLLGLLRQNQPDSCIIFCNTKKTVEIVAKRLQRNGLKTDFLIGDLPQQKRLRLIESFKAGDLVCLVATDVAARGLDVNDLKMVINYDLPAEAENYVHRIGRTARAGKTGSAYSLCCEQDVYNLPAIEKYIEIKLDAVIPVDTDFVEDLSAGSYIQLDRDSGKKRVEAKHAGKAGTRQGSRSVSAEGKKRERKERSRKPNSVQAPTGAFERKKSAHLESLTFEQRMAYYKQQYASQLADSTIDTRTAGASQTKKPASHIEREDCKPAAQKKRRKRPGKPNEKKVMNTGGRPIKTTAKQLLPNEEAVRPQPKRTFLAKVMRFLRKQHE
ncbi:MAG: DEAD/DEAH box helicase [Treponema sp.]